VLTQKPNAAHLALAECEKRMRKQGRSMVIITQNIDDLHRQAGSKHVLNIHGERAAGHWDAAFLGLGGYC
jgi:NAD-dependent deacetylase sirtuin 5